MKRVIVALVFLALSASPNMGQSEAGTGGQAGNLRGLTGVQLIVMFGRADGLPDEAQRAEVLKLLEDDAKAKLQQAGIRFSPSPLVGDVSIAGNPRLIVFVTLDKLNGFVPPIRTEVKLVKRVQLVRDPSIEFDAVIWSRGGTGAPKLKIPVIQSLVADLITDFIRDYLSVNPKQSVSSGKVRSKYTKR